MECIIFPCLQKSSSGKISKMRPFGYALQYSLENARIDNENPDYALWVEEDYCSPPLVMERESMLDQYFNDIAVLRVESEGDRPVHRTWFERLRWVLSIKMANAKC